MSRTHSLGFPRIGAQRELKFAEEKHWKGLLTHAELEQTAAELRARGWQRQAELDFVPVGDFSFYDPMTVGWTQYARCLRPLRIPE